ncbi:MAG: peptidoglycan editing factor PgeF [Gammaproteobacteria bacterium]|nr:peptidoglycan editing factor PgeF [Gammaproteobacteria bacterium]MDH5730033.1 peptidoglycan editing factor PgeF [Gammaproteobacteria bacterium]
MLNNWILPDWDAPANVAAISTSRAGGFSEGDYASLNLALHVGDAADTVRRNRDFLKNLAALPNEPIWLQQIHGKGLLNLDTALSPENIPEADGSFTGQTGRVCVVMTADCLPILLCDRQGSWVAALHGGWRGLQQGIIQQAIRQYPGEPQQLLAWLGPAIGPDAFEVGQDVFDAFAQLHTDFTDAFKFKSSQHYWADIYEIARIQLAQLGVYAISGGDYCTYHDSERFFSYRRQQNTGRMATLCWLRA